MRAVRTRCPMLTSTERQYLRTKTSITGGKLDPRLRTRLRRRIRSKFIIYLNDLDILLDDTDPRFDDLRKELKVLVNRRRGKPTLGLKLPKGEILGPDEE